MRLIATTALVAVLLQASPTLAGALMAKDMPSAVVMKSSSEGPHQSPSLSSSQIAAIQYREEAVQYQAPLSSRCQTRAGISTIYPLRPIDTTCVVNGLPGFMLP